MPVIVPSTEDLTTDDFQALATGRIDEVAERLQLSRDNLRRLISRDDVARDTILAARAEFQALLELRVSLMSVDALDTLEAVMEGSFDKEVVGAAIRAADSILDRGLLPKQTRIQRETGAPTSKKGLPELSDLVQRAENDNRAHEIVDQYMDILRKVEAMRLGAREVIDGESVRT
jgi:hypothetical protein